MRLNSTFISNIRTLYGDAGKLWLEQLPVAIEKLSKEWQFQFVNPLPNLTYNFVGLVSMNSTEKTAILKMSPPGGNAPVEIRWLSCFKTSVPKIYLSDETQNVFVMEDLQPGNP